LTTGSAAGKEAGPAVVAVRSSGHVAWWVVNAQGGFPDLAARYAAGTTAALQNKQTKGALGKPELSAAIVRMQSCTLEHVRLHAD
jgi:L-amino acid N-acyltransferase YncA